ncbi:MAG: thiamine diphosphokinase [Spirochaetales bacterium]|nr:thiamine diphosphokinase [Spirochaetales bacterium]
MRALLLTGGEAPPLSAVAGHLGRFGLVCAADSGLDLAATWGLEPDLIAGDMDSVSDLGLVGAYPRARVHFVPREKDETDTELGLRLLREAGANRVVLAGGGGGRLDHLLAVRALFERADGPEEWWAPGERVLRLSGGRSWKAEPGSLVSVFPLASGASGMSSRGLRWPLEGLEWGPGGFGVSNETVDREFSIESGAAPLLVVLPYGASDLPA